MEKVSLYIPCHDAEMFVKECLDSILNQSYEIDEIIVIDDASDEPYEFNYSNVMILRNKLNKGAPYCRNMGLLHASGEYILMLDDDVEIDTIDFIKKGLNIFQTCKDIKMVTPLKIDRTKKGEFEVSCFAQRKVDGQFKKIIAKKGYVDFGCMVYLAEKQALVEIGGYDTAFGDMKGHSYREETDLQVRLRKSGYKIYYDPELKIYHNILDVGGQDRNMSSITYWTTRNHVVYLGKHNSLYKILIYLSIHVVILNLIYNPAALIYAIRGWIDGTKYVLKLNNSKSVKE